jgi:hypothetical protein
MGLSSLFYNRSYIINFKVVASAPFCVVCIRFTAIKDSFSWPISSLMSFL